MERYVRFVEKNRKKMLIVMILLNILALIGLFRIRINPSFETLIPKNSIRVEEYRKVNDIFGTQDQLTIVLKFDGDVRNVQMLNLLKKIERDLGKIDGVKSVVGPVPSILPEGLFRIERIDKVTEKNLKDILEFMDENEIMKSIVVKDGRSYCMFTLFPKKDADTRDMVLKIEGYLKKDRFKYGIIGNTYLEVKIFDYILMIILLLPPSAVVIMLLIFKWQLGHMKPTVFSILPAGIGALWTMGFIGWFVRDITIITVLVPIFTIVMGSADGLHFVSHFLDKLRDGRKSGDAIVETLRIVGIAMLMTTLTTMAGFLSLTVIKSNAMVQMGVLASIGIGLAFVSTILFLPVLLIGMKITTTPKRKSLDPVTPLIGRIMRRFSIPFTMIVLIGFIPGLFMLKTDFNMLEMYKGYTKIRRDFEEIKEVYGISPPVFGFFESKIDPIDPRFAVKILNFEDDMGKMDKVLKVYSFYDIMSMVYRRMYKTNDRYPDNLAKANFLYRLMINTQKEGLENLFKREKKVGRIIVFPSDFKSNTLNSIESKLKSGDMKAVGMPYIIKEMNDSIIPQQIQSILLAMFLVFMMLLITQRNLKVALVSIIPISITLVVLFGFMGYTGINLSVVTANMAGITIGVGIDYAIHYSALFRYYRKEGSIKPHVDAFNDASKPIIANAMGLAMGLTVMNLSPLSIHTYLSMIMWVTMLASSFLSLTILPNLLSKLR